MSAPPIGPHQPAPPTVADVRDRVLFWWAVALIASVATPISLLIALLVGRW